MGDDFIEVGDALVLRVPSVIIPDEYNYLVNPSHSDFTQTNISAPEAFTFDAAAD